MVADVVGASFGTGLCRSLVLLSLRAKLGAGYDEMAGGIGGTRRDECQKKTQR